LYYQLINKHQKQKS